MNSLLRNSLYSTKSYSYKSYDSSFKNTIFGIGNILLDVTVDDYDDSFIEMYDLEVGEALTIDWVRDRHLPLMKEIMEYFEPSSIHFTPGGSTLNAFSAFQWMLNKGDGCSTFLGCIGDDEWGEILFEMANNLGIDLNLYVKNESTGSCISLVSGNGERTCIADLASSKKMGFDFYLEHQHLQNNAKMYYYSGYYIPVFFEGILENAKHAKDGGKIFGINLSANFLIELYIQELFELMDYSTHIFSNSDEARCLGRVMGWTEEIEIVGKKLLEHFPFDKTRKKTVVFTQGADPTLVFEQLENGEEVVMRSFDVENSSVCIVDTNGAGDCFVGGFLSQLAQERSLEDCINAAHYVSKIIVETSGVVFPEHEPPDPPFC